MTKLVLAKILFAGVTIISTTALIGPVYIGERSENPEKETYGILMEPAPARPIAFIGPARYFGPVTGDDEKDTFAYRPLFGEQKNGLWSFRLESE
jgi:hypothetical protein